jgi:hypothetical protein
MKREIKEHKIIPKFEIKFGNNTKGKPYALGGVWVPRY